MKKKTFTPILLVLLCLIVLFGSRVLPNDDILVKTDALTSEDNISSVEYGKEYTEKQDVAMYLYYYEELPKNYITKSDAKALG